MTRASAPRAPAEDLGALGLELDPGQVDKLGAFAGLIVKWNARFNLLARRDVERLWPRHILDSLSVVKLVRGPRVLDLGSGGGFPGLPLAIALRDHEFVLLDRNQRKCRFLELAAAQLELANVTVRCGDVEALSGRFDTVVSRAVAPPEALQRLAAPALASGGILLALASTRVAGGDRKGTGRSLMLNIPGLDQPHEVVIIELPGADG